MEPPAWAPRLTPGDSDLQTISLGGDPRLPWRRGSGGREGLGGGSEPPRPATEGNAVGARGTIGSRECCAPEWRRRPAGLTDAPAARRDWATLDPAAAAAARSAVVKASPAFGVVPHLPAPPPRRGAELTLSATPSSAAAASSRVNSSTSIRREKLKGLGPESPREAGTSPGKRNGEAPPSRSTSGAGKAPSSSKTGTSLPLVRFLPPFPAFLPRVPSLFSTSLPRAWGLRLLPHHVTHRGPTSMPSRTPSSRPSPSPRHPRGGRMRTGPGSRAARPAAASCPPAESWDWVWEAGFLLVPPLQRESSSAELTGLPSSYRC